MSPTHLTVACPLCEWIASCRAGPTRDTGDLIFAADIHAALDLELRDHIRVEHVIQSADGGRTPTLALGE